MDGPTVSHTKGSKSDRERHIAFIAYIYNLEKRIHMNLFTKQKQTHRHRKKKSYGYQRDKFKYTHYYI